MVEGLVAEDVEDGGEGFVFDEVGLGGELDQGRSDVEGLGLRVGSTHLSLDPTVVGSSRRWGTRIGGGLDYVEALAAGDLAAGGVGFGEGFLHGVEGVSVDEGADEGFGVAWVTDGDGLVDATELGEELVVDRGVDEEAAEGGAALAGGAHGGEGDGAEGEREIGRRADDAGVVAAELEEGAGEALGEAGADGSAHAGGAGGGDEGDEGGVDEGFADGVVADEEGGEVGREVAGVLVGEFAGGALKEGLGGEGGERGLFGGLPDDGVSADESEGGVPAPDGDGEVEGGDDAGDAEGVPLLHHAVVGALGGDGEAADGAGEADGVDADVDHLLDLAAAFGEDFAGFEGDEAAERVEVGAELLAEEADELAAAGHGDLTPVEEGLVSGSDDGVRVWDDGDVGEEFAGDGSACGEGAAGELGGGDAEVEEEVTGFRLEGGLGGEVCGCGLGDGWGAHFGGPGFQRSSASKAGAPFSLPCLREIGAGAESCGVAEGCP